MWKNHLKKIKQLILKLSKIEGHVWVFVPMRFFSLHSIHNHVILSSVNINIILDIAILSKKELCNIERYVWAYISLSVHPHPIQYLIIILFPVNISRILDIAIILKKQLNKSLLNFNKVYKSYWCTKWSTVLFNKIKN